MLSRRSTCDIFTCMWAILENKCQQIFHTWSIYVSLDLIIEKQSRCWNGQSWILCKKIGFLAGELVNVDILIDTWQAQGLNCPTRIRRPRWPVGGGGGTLFHSCTTLAQLSKVLQHLLWCELPVTSRCYQRGIQSVLHMTFTCLVSVLPGMGASGRWYTSHPQWFQKNELSKLTRHPGRRQRLPI